LEAARVAAENHQARDQENRTRTAINESFLGWLKGELEKAASHIGSGGLKCEVHTANLASDGQFNVQSGDRSLYRAISGLELALEDMDQWPGRKHILELFLCETVSIRGRQTSLAAQPARDVKLAFLPRYRQTLSHQPQMAALVGYLSFNSAAGNVRGIVDFSAVGRGGNPQVGYTRVEIISRSFQPDVNRHLDFRASEWPGNVEELRAALSEAIGTFIEFVKQGAGTLGV
jgi:hypothetical protein